eukprot:g52583.t1
MLISAGFTALLTLPMLWTPEGELGSTVFLEDTAYQESSLDDGEEDEQPPATSRPASSSALDVRDVDARMGASESKALLLAMHHSNPKAVLWSPQYITLVLGNFVDGSLILSSHALMSLILKDDYLFAEDQVGFVFTAYAITSCLASLFLFKPVAACLGPFRMVVWTGLIKALLFLAMGFVLTAERFRVPNLWWLYSGLVILFGLFFNVSTPALTFVVSQMVEKFEPENFGLLNGVRQSMFALGQTVGPLIAVEVFLQNRLAPFAFQAALWGLVCVVLQAIAFTGGMGRFGVER